MNVKPSQAHNTQGADGPSRAGPSPQSQELARLLQRWQGGGIEEIQVPTRDVGRLVAKAGNQDPVAFERGVAEQMCVICGTDAVA